VSYALKPSGAVIVLLALGLVGIVLAGGALTLVAILAGCASSAEEVAHQSTVVARVGDGDTLDVRSGARVRLVQIDAPELGGGECYARESKRELERLTPRGTRVQLVGDAALDDVDRYGRLLRYVRVDETNVNVELVRQGAAAPYFRRGERGRYADELLDAVDEARTRRRGMWGSCRVEWDPGGPVSTRPR
jgi:endonuclease YncB( thermonuclease family)